MGNYHQDSSDEPLYRPVQALSSRKAQLNVQIQDSGLKPKVVNFPAHVVTQQNTNRVIQSTSILFRIRKKR